MAGNVDIAHVSVSKIIQTAYKLASAPVLRPKTNFLILEHLPRCQIDHEHKLQQPKIHRKCPNLWHGP